PPGEAAIDYRRPFHPEPLLIVISYPPEELAKTLGLAEIAVDHDKANIGDEIEGKQRLHDQFVDMASLGGTCPATSLKLRNAIAGAVFVLLRGGDRS